MRAVEYPLTSYITDKGPSSGAVVSPRSHLVSDAPTVSLDGSWRFRLLPAAPGAAGSEGVLPDGEQVEAVAEPDFDDSDWATIAVPAHWVLPGNGEYGSPIYTNVQFPFATEAPHVPDANPTGDYRRTFEIPSDWADRATVEAVWLRFEGVESRYRVWVNGSLVGVGVGSRLTTEFDVTDFVHSGENLIVVRVHQWSASSYVEDQDQWWLPGIFRSVSVLARPAGGIPDAWIHADFDHTTLTGSVTPELRASAESFPITLTIAELGIERVWADPSEVTPFDVGTVEPWSADVPRLYSATVASAAETISVRLGFRTVSIVGDQFEVNGRRVAFHGVNRHESDPLHGRVFDETRVRRDLEMMKRYNVNAIRTSHYPPQARLLDIADELGFWVILECDLETHGFEHIDDDNPWAGNPSDDPDWRNALVDRMQRTVERDKNHPSIVMWSLGNESGTGSNLAAMSSWVHTNDPTRPVHYEGDYSGRYTDVYSRMYASIPELQTIGDSQSSSLLFQCSPAESARQRTKPFLLCEYAHAMGNGPGGFQQYEDSFARYPRLHGGFVWEWRDHGLKSVTPAGEEFFAYGGDFGEVVHDGNFVMDGLTLSDGRPTPALDEFAAVVSPIRFAFAEPGTVTITNTRHSGDTGDLSFEWALSHDGHEVETGTIAVEPIAAGQSQVVTLDLPASSDRDETWITVTAHLASDTPWAPAGHVLSFAQQDLTPPLVRTRRLSERRLRSDRARHEFPVGASTEVSADPVGGTLSLGPATFRDGRLTELGGDLVSGPRLELWRAPTDNDEGSVVEGSYDIADPWADGGRGIAAPAHADDWRRMGLDRLVGRTVSLVQTPSSLRRVTRWSAANIRESVFLSEHWEAIGDDVLLHVDVEPSRGWDITWPRIGIRFDFPQRYDEVSWFGTGPNESYPDSRRAARVGRFTAAADTIAFPYARPQESGHRSDLRTLTLTGTDGRQLRIDTAEDLRGRLPGFSISGHTAQQLTAATHIHELPPSESTYLYVDAAQHGLGSRSCGPDVWPDQMLKPEARSLSLRFSAGAAPHA